MTGLVKSKCYNQESDGIQKYLAVYYKNIQTSFINEMCATKIRNKAISIVDI